MQKLLPNFILAKARIRHWYFYYNGTTARRGPSASSFLIFARAKRGVHLSFTTSISSLPPSDSVALVQLLGAFLLSYHDEGSKEQEQEGSAAAFEGRHSRGGFCKLVDATFSRCRFRALYPISRF